MAKVSEILFPLDPLQASSPRIFQTSTQADFLKGEIENLSIDSRGQVVLGLLRARELQADPQQFVDQVMRPGPSTYRPFVPVEELRGIMSDRNLESSPVTTSDGRLVGLVRRQDVGLGSINP